MDRSWTVLLIALISWIALKFLGLGSWTWETSNQYGIFLNLGWLTVISAMESYHALQRETNFLDRWKSSARKALRYSLLLIPTLGIWYYAIVPESIEQRKNQQLQLLESMTSDPVLFAQFLASNPALADRTPQEVYNQQAENIQVFFSPIFYLGTVAMAWVFGALIVTAIFTWIWGRVWISPQKPY